jgi:hypothetical protein
MRVSNPWKALKARDTEKKDKFMALFDQYNATIGNALGILEEQPQDIQGRDKEIKMLYRILERPKTPIALLVGPAGVGKTALVEEFAKQLNSGSYDTKLNYNYMLLSLRLGNLASIGVSKLQSALSKLLENLKDFETLAQAALNDPNLRIVLFIDEVHMMVTIFGPGTKIGGDVMKDILARSPVRVICATTRREYDSTIAVDQPFAQRFKQIEMNELSKPIVRQICKNWWKKVAPDLEELPETMINRIIDANEVYRSDSAEPRKTIDILEDLVSYSRITGEQADEHVVNQIFKERYSINLKFSVDADSVADEIDKNIKGQPFARYTLRRALRALVYDIDQNSNRPLGTFLFTGPTGVGKSETTKVLARALYPGENVLQNINMPDYKTPEHEPGFRKRLGEAVRHVPNSVILFDELEKADESILDSLLAILDEGIVTFETMNREGNLEVNHVSLRNTIIIATTNAGHEIFDNDAKFSQRDSDTEEEVNRSEITRLQQALRSHLITAGFKPELLGRFKRRVPYRSLSEAELLEIAETKINNLVTTYRDLKDIELIIDPPRQWPEDTYNYFTTDVALDITFIRARASDANGGGARRINDEIEENLKDELIEAIVDNPECKKFYITVSKDSKIYDSSVDSSVKGVHVHAIK